jgi:transcriptional regulator with XRE-family HTH domain
MVGDNIRGYRKKKNITQIELAAKAKLSPNFLSAFENGRETLSLKSLERLIKALKIPPHLLLVPESYREDPK